MGILGPPGNHATQWIRDLWLKSVSLILAYFKTFLSFCVLDYFFSFSKNSFFWVFLVHPTVVSVLLSASVERCFVKALALWADAFYKLKCPSVFLSFCPSVCSLLRYRFKVFLPKVGCPIFLEIQNPWGEKNLKKRSHI